VAVALSLMSAYIVMSGTFVNRKNSGRRLEIEIYALARLKWGSNRPSSRPRPGRKRRFQDGFW
jgi:hypothetical protein